MHSVRWPLLGLIALPALVLPGCDEKKETPLQQEARLIGRAVQVAQDQIRSDTKMANARFRGVMPWTQVLPNHVAVCGQVAPSGDATDGFVPFVSVVAYAADGNVGSARVVRGVTGSLADGGSQVYRAMLDHCWERGGPRTASASVTTPQTPVPTDPAARVSGQPSAPMPAVQVPAPAASMPAPVPDPASAASAAGEPPSTAGSVTMRQSGNLRASPQGAIVRVVQRGTALKVFTQAPGGWYEVGDAAPWGWIHSSMLDKR